MRISDWSSDVCSSDLSLRFKRATVDTTLNRKDGKPPIAVSFSMRDDNGEWKVWDIKAENISLVLNFRTQIDAEIKKSSIPAVIERLNNGQIQADVDHDEIGRASCRERVCQYV